MTHNSEEKEEKETRRNQEEKEEEKNLSKINNSASKMQGESAVQYVAKLKAKLHADRNARMAAAKPTVAKEVVKSQQVDHVKLPP